jgi:hypothetical protein
MSIFLFDVNDNKFTFIGKFNVHNFKVFSNCSEKGVFYVLTQQKTFFKIIKYRLVNGDLKKEVISLS